MASSTLVHELLEARDERRLLRLQKHLAAARLLIVDELGLVPLSKADAELLFEVFSQRYEHSSTLVTSNLPFQEWREVLGSVRLGVGGEEGIWSGGLRCGDQAQSSPSCFRLV